MKYEDICWEKVSLIQQNSGNDDEYSHCTWGSREDISNLCNWLYLAKDKIIELRDAELKEANIAVGITEIYGIQVSTIRELFDLFNEKGFNLRKDEDFDRIKLQFFGKINSPKILKELGLFVPQGWEDVKGHNPSAVFVEDLKKGAIQWLKSKSPYLNDNDGAVAEWIKHFFGITEEELKC